MPTSETVCVAGITEDSIVDGPGLRAVVFVQGCPHHCDGCHNPQTHPFEGAGEKLSVSQIYQRIRRNPLQRGVTLSGGEPFCQPGPLAILAEKLHHDGYDIAVYTGYTLEQLMERNDPCSMNLLRWTHVLIDGPFLLSQQDRSLPFRGSRNQRILDVHASLTRGCAVICDDPAWNPQ
ncbi:MAG: anaerobic ribonucleoside-triphosphate reductase activating protein [Planctomycetia bacterium]|nr:anaerobic ribonucleoside-triphosphate reductase activating protein [Planctomycetia bacterium]